MTTPANTTPVYRSVLQQEFLVRKGRNPAFSLRAFSRQLGISKTALAEALACKRHLSSRNALKLAERLAFSPDATKRMLTDIHGIDSPALDANYHTLDEDTFSVISEWYYFAILNLAKLKRHKADAHWIARRLGISPLEVRQALLRLERMGFLEIRDGRLVRRVASLNTSEGIPSAALRKFHKQNLVLALTSIDRDSVADRYNTSITMAIDSGRLLAARRLFLRFRDRMCAYLESDNPDSVYTMAFHVFPVVRPISRKELK